MQHSSKNCLQPSLGEAGENVVAIAGVIACHNFDKHLLVIMLLKHFVVWLLLIDISHIGFFCLHISHIGFFCLHISQHGSASFVLCI